MSVAKTAAKGNNLIHLLDGTYTATGMSFAAAGLCIAVDKIVDSSATGTPGKGNLKVTGTMKYYNEDMDKFINFYSTSNTDEDEKIVYEDKTEEVFSSTLPVTKTFGAIWVGGSIGGKVPVVFGRAKLSGNTGDVKYSSKSAETPFEITFISGVTQTFAEDCFTGTAMAALFSTPGKQELSPSVVGSRIWTTGV